MGLLFKEEDLYEENNDPIDDPEITQVILYYGKADAELLKKLLKEGMKQDYPETYREQNISVQIFDMAKKNYGHLIPKIEETPVASTSGSAQGDIPEQRSL